MAHDMSSEGLIEVDTAMLRLDANRLELFKKVIAEGGGPTRSPRAERLPGAAVGKAVQRRRRPGVGHPGRAGDPGPPRPPDDYHGMIRSEGIPTSAGGTNSHAAVVARARASRRCGRRPGPGRPPGRKFTAGGTEVAEGDWTIDGFTGKVYAGQLELADSPIEQAQGGDAEARGRSGRLTSASWAGPMRSAGSGCGPMPTPRPVGNAIERGAEGIGLCRTERVRGAGGRGPDG